MPSNPRDLPSATFDEKSLAPLPVVPALPARVGRLRSRFFFGDLALPAEDLTIVEVDDEPEFAEVPPVVVSSR